MSVNSWRRMKYASVDQSLYLSFNTKPSFLTLIKPNDCLCDQFPKVFRASDSVLCLQLPRAVSTQTLSGAGFLKMINKATDAVSKMTIKMNESDAVSPAGKPRPLKVPPKWIQLKQRCCVGFRGSQTQLVDDDDVFSCSGLRRSSRRWSLQTSTSGSFMLWLNH